MENVLSIENLLIENAALKAELSEVKAKLDRLMEQLSSHRRKLFGVSSEKTVYNCNNEQLTYMDDPPGLLVVHEVGPANAVEPEPPQRVRPIKRGEMSTRLPPDMPVEIIRCELSDDELAGHGGQMRAIGSSLVRRELKITPAKATIIEIWQTSYSSKDSEQNDETPNIVKAPLPPQVIKGSMCAPETAASIIVQKYVMGVPVYRQCQDWNRKGIPLTKQTMLNWLVTVCMIYFMPIFNELHRLLLTRSILLSDSTVFQVLNEVGKSPQSDSCMWMYRTGADAEHPIILFDYQPDKKKERPIEFLKGYSGYLTTDGYAGYRSLPEAVILTGCLAHARSYFTDALKCLKSADRPGSLALVGQEYCNKLFGIEREIKDKSFDERFDIRNEKAAPIFGEFKSWLDSIKPHVSTESKLGKAIGYALNQWTYLNRYLLDGRIEISNNFSEIAIKNFVINRKNFLFASSEAGGRAAAVLQSITETAKASKLDPYKYINHVLHEAAGRDLNKETELLQKLLPQNAPVSCFDLSHTQNDNH